MKPRGAELALVWIAKENGKPWREPREAWNREQPEDRPYGSEREFARACGTPIATSSATTNTRGSETMPSSWIIRREMGAGRATGFFIGSAAARAPLATPARSRSRGRARAQALGRRPVGDARAGSTNARAETGARVDVSEATRVYQRSAIRRAKPLLPRPWTRLTRPTWPRSSVRSPRPASRTRRSARR